MINDRDIIKGNYFLDRSNKILRVDDIQYGYNDKNEYEAKISMENIVNVEPSILYPNGLANIHPYTEYKSYLKGINLSINHEIDGDAIFKGFNEEGCLIVNDYYVVTLSFYDAWNFIIDYKTSVNKYPIYYEQSFFDVHHIQNIVYGITGFVLELKDEFLLKTIKNGCIIK